MSVSVVIPSLLTHPACDEAFASVLRAARSIPDSEVIVVANGPGRRRQVPEGIRLIECRGEGGSAARNEGMRAARHRLVLFTDDDCLVPDNWCQELVSAFGTTKAAAIAGPVDVPVLGPVTAYLGYQRAWDAAPATATTALYVVTSNCAIDRAQVPIEFDETLVECMDLDFGYRIRDLGGTIAWIDRPAVTHQVAEGAADLVRRYLNWGRSIAKLHLAGRPLDDPGYLLQSYAELCAGEPGYNRRFREILSQEQRTVFTALHLAFLSSYQAGYLDGLGQSLIRVDQSSLISAWVGLMSRFSGWGELSTDLSRFAIAMPADPVHAEVGRILSTYAPLTGAEPMLPADSSGSEDWQTTAKTVGGFADLVHQGTTAEVLHQLMRAAGIPFNLGMSMLEGAMDPAAAEWFASVQENV